MTLLHGMGFTTDVTMKRRLDAALEALRTSSGIGIAAAGGAAVVSAAPAVVGGGSQGANMPLLVCVADSIPVGSDGSYLRGHGTQQAEDKSIRATVCGVVQRINRLVTVQPFKSRYGAQTGDVVVGRVVEVGAKRWKVDVGAGQDATLMLSAVNLPGGIQRRRTAVDELNMRGLFEEGDVISAEVQSCHQDGSMVLHTRSDKYGKAVGGQLVKVPPYLIQRLKHHFLSLPCKVHLILGCNGWVWVSQPPSTSSSSTSATPASPLHSPAGSIPTEVSTEALTEAEATQDGTAAAHAVVPRDMRERVCRVAAATRALAAVGLPVEPGSVTRAYEKAVAMGCPVQRMADASFLVVLLEGEVEHRAKQGIKKGR